MSRLPVLQRQNANEMGSLIHAISKQLPVLLIEHDIDRVFSIADAVTVMHEGKVLIDGTVEDARNSPEVQTIYIGFRI
jgi:ABC-type branched-subunit amino acid transport system ATPase component